MNYKIIKLKSFKVCGYSTELTTSMSENYKISKKFWYSFNRRIRTGSLTQGKFWTKYGFVYNKNNKYRYLTAIPFIEPTPLDFEIMEVPQSYCIVFDHIGSLDKLNNTINKIYRQFLPSTSFKPDTSNYFYFEKYDYRFNYNNNNSVIEIYLPISILKEVIYTD